MKKGFTLLELLVVVIVIALLATFAIPQYLKAVERTKVSKARAHLKLLEKAEIMYRADNDTYLAIAFLAPIDSSGLGDYVELIGLDNDNDWDYLALVVGSALYLVARRQAGPYFNRTIFITSTGLCSTNHPLGGCN